MDLSSVLSSLGTGSYTLTRRTKQVPSTGGRVATTSGSTSTISACVTPVGGRDLQRLPEGLRTQQLRSVFTVTELKTTGSGFEADVLTIDGDAWQVQTVFPYSTLGNFWQAIVMRVGN